MNYLLIYLEFIDQIIENRDKRRNPMRIVLKSFVPKVVPQPWMDPHEIWEIMCWIITFNLHKWTFFFACENWM